MIHQVESPIEGHQVAADADQDGELSLEEPNGIVKKASEPKQDRDNDQDDREQPQKIIGNPREILPESCRNPIAIL